MASSGFGTYINKQSFLHNLNPSLKFIGFVFLIVLIFLPLGFFGLTILFVVLITLWTTSKLPFRLMKGILKSILVMFLILLLVNWIAYKMPSVVIDLSHQGSIAFGKESFYLWNGLGTLSVPVVNTNDSYVSYLCLHGPLWGGQTSGFVAFPSDLPVKDIKDYFENIGFKDVSYQKTQDGLYWIALGYSNHWYTLSCSAIIYSFYVSMKVFLMIIIVTLLISTTTSVQLTFAIEDILHPLKFLKIPVNEWSMTIAIAIRFVPSLLDESQRILKAQSSRGVDFSNGNFKDKIKSIVSLVVPMFSVAFHKADDLANAMEARSYNPRYTRTRYRNYTVDWWDWLLFGILSLLLGAFILFSADHLSFAPYSWFDAILIFGV